MADKCLYEPINGTYPNCNGACKRGKRSCEYYFIDEIYHLVKQWKKEAKVETPLLTRMDKQRKKFIIYTTKPGYLIGYKGQLYEKYQDLLLDRLRFYLCNDSGPLRKDEVIEFIECDDAII